jgi:5S rRNA maturation endonuclease (ribonuclease M5)/KaiC/GvpD/RAD55 family RecA-like ATPase
MIAEHELLDRFEKVKRQADGSWLASCRCSVHRNGDRHPSLHLTLTADRWLLKCQSGGDIEDVMAAAGLDWADLFAGNGKREIVAAFDYVDERGELLFQGVRFHPKDFRQRRPDGNGDWEWDLEGVRRVPYRLPKVIEAVEAGRRVWVVEGEKDVHALERAGEVATCNPGGADKWRKEYGKPLRGATVAIIADTDKAGRRHARAVAEALEGIAATVKVGEPAEGKDAADHLKAGRGLDEFVPLEESPGFDPERWRVLDVAVMAQGDPPEVPREVDGLVVRGDVTILTANPGTGKSLLSLALSAAKPRDESVAGMDCRRGTVLYVDAESGAGEIHRRVHSLGVPTEGVVVVEADGVDVRGERDFGQLEALIEYYGPSLVVLDSLTALWPGANERKTEDVAPTLYEFKRLAERCNVGVLILHHRPKDGGEYRGTTAIAPATQLGFALSRVKGDPDRLRRRLSCWKCRPAPEPEDRWLHLAAEDGMVLVEAASPYTDPDEPERPQAPVREKLKPRILAALGDDRLSLKELADRIGLPPKDQTLRRSLADLEKDGEILRDDAKKYSRCQVSGVKPLRGRDTVTPDTSLSRAENGAAPETGLCTCWPTPKRLPGELECRYCGKRFREAMA